MGAGKSSVAQMLGKKLNMKVIEMDEMILQISGRKSISDIFSLDGENKFRLLEQQIARQISNEENIIVSTGGGVVMNKINIDNLKENGKIVFLKTSFLEIKKRLKNISDRPLFKNKIKAEKLFVSRQKLYEESADLVINTDGKSVDEVTLLTIKKL